MGLGRDFLDLKTKIQSMKVKISQLDFIKIKKFCCAKGPVKRMNSQIMQWEKIFANHAMYTCIPNKELLLRIYKEFSKLNSENTKKSNYKMSRRQLDKITKETYKRQIGTCKAVQYP